MSLPLAPSSHHSSHPGGSPDSKSPSPRQWTPGSLSPGGLHAAPGAGRTQVVSQPWPPSGAEGAQGRCWPLCPAPQPSTTRRAAAGLPLRWAERSLSGQAWLEGPWSWKPRSVVGGASHVPCPTLGTRPAGGLEPGEGDVGGCSSTDGAAQGEDPGVAGAHSPYGAVAFSLPVSAPSRPRPDPGLTRGPGS